MTLKPTSLISDIARYFSSNETALPASVITRRLRWELRHKLNLLGWPGTLAIGLLVISPVFYFSAVRPMQARVDTAQTSIAAAKEQIDKAAVAAHGGFTTPREQLTEFYKYFPAVQDSPEWLDKLIELADENDLSLNEGEYKVSKDKTGQLVRYSIDLPLEGNYPQLREFLAAIPGEIPAMALENVQFQRKDIVDTKVQAKIRLVLYLVQES
jgi:hypothetical protein